MGRCGVGSEWRHLYKNKEWILRADGMNYSSHPALIFPT